ncbi:MerR family transcriptional regulator [Naasia sp. SYSU D00057]|uniref:MerR family transcriptional regulator n=1 Tax=Naasia sp. SYSU D00057 TaxID=2817380 RepID=UPI001B314984|nr:MerR family transcriptional regulator [Naasia sp. SYSU D00057]
MRISELSRRSRVPVPSIKYYVREGLLPAGTALGPTSSEYGEQHVKRLHLIRALIDIGGLSIATAKDVLGAVDSPDLSLAHVFERAQLAVSRTAVYSAEGSDESRRRLDELVEAQGWHVGPGNPGRVAASNILDAFDALGLDGLRSLLTPYAQAAAAIAEVDLRAVAAQPDIEAMTETVVAGTVLGDALLAALRRMAQEHMTSVLFPSPTSSPPAA